MPGPALLRTERRRHERRRQQPGPRGLSQGKRNSFNKYFLYKYYDNEGPQTADFLLVFLILLYTLN